MADQEQKSSAYTIVVDEELDGILGLLFQVATMSPQFFPTLIHRGEHERFLAFLKQNAQQTHKMGWCKDPNCETPQG